MRAVSRSKHDRAALGAIAQERHDTVVACLCVSHDALVAADRERRHTSSVHRGATFPHPGPVPIGTGGQLATSSCSAEITLAPSRRAPSATSRSEDATTTGRSRGTVGTSCRICSSAVVPAGVKSTRDGLTLRRRDPARLRAVEHDPHFGTSARVQPNEAIEQSVTLLDERRQLGPRALGDVVAVDHHDDVAQRDEVSSRVVGVVVQPAGQRLRAPGVLRGTDAAVVRERFVSLRAAGLRNRADRIVERPGRCIERATGVVQGGDHATEIGRREAVHEGVRAAARRNRGAASSASRSAAQPSAAASSSRTCLRRLSTSHVTL